MRGDAMLIAATSMSEYVDRLRLPQEPTCQTRYVVALCARRSLYKACSCTQIGKRTTDIRIAVAGFVWLCSTAVIVLMLSHFSGPIKLARQRVSFDG